MDPLLRPARAADAEACGRIMHRAFHEIAARHGFPPDFPTPESGIALAEALIADPGIYGVVAEADGEIVGSNFMSEGDRIRGIGPITVQPAAQARGLGRRLMEAVLERADGTEGTRLLQDAFNMRSLALYASLGFAVREPVVVMSGRPRSAAPAGVAARAMRQSDLEACERLCVASLGVSRRGDLANALQRFSPLVLERDGGLAAYMTAPTLWLANHAVAESEADMRSLILAAAAGVPGPLSFLLPTRQAALFRWCLQEGLQAVKPMTLMTRGDYQPPRGAYMTSVFY